MLKIAPKIISSEINFLTNPVFYMSNTKLTHCGEIVAEYISRETEVIFKYKALQSIPVGAFLHIYSRSAVCMGSFKLNKDVDVGNFILVSLSIRE